MTAKWSFTKPDLVRESVWGVDRKERRLGTITHEMGRAVYSHNQR